MTPFDGDLEFDDVESAFAFTNVNLGRLRDPRLLQVLAGVVIGLGVAAWPARTDRILVRLIGLIVIVIAFSIIQMAIRRPPRKWLEALAGLAVVAVGAYLIAFPNRSIVFVGRVFALVIIVFTARELILAIRRRRDTALTIAGLAWPIAKAFAGLASAALIAGYPSELLALATVIISLGWAGIGAMAVSASLRAEQVTNTDENSTEVEDANLSMRSGDVVLGWLDERSKEAGDRRTLYEKILFEGSALKTKVGRFLALMTFASIIASMGVVTDSTAVVIGAMLIAPLMTPLMGIAISIVMGWPNRLARSASIALAGILLAIAIGVVLGIIVPTSIDVAGNSQIIGRSSPTILDLITATAAGGAGAYGLSRPDVSDALPGVAIAISLVPPLSVVGIAYSQGAWSDGNGALLLFITNALAIIIVGGLTFVVTGVAPVRRVADNQQRVRTATATVVALGALVAGALGINGGQIAANALDRDNVDRAAFDWITTTPEFNLVSTRIDGDRVTVVVIGPAAGSPNIAGLREGLIEELGRDVIADVRIVVQERETLPPDTTEPDAD